MHVRVVDVRKNANDALCKNTAGDNPVMRVTFEKELLVGFKSSPPSQEPLPRLKRPIDFIL
jgi:hypothetical protein